MGTNTPPRDQTTVDTTTTTTSNTATNARPPQSQSHSQSRFQRFWRERGLSPAPPLVFFFFSRSLRHFPFRFAVESFSVTAFRLPCPIFACLAVFPTPFFFCHPLF